MSRPNNFTFISGSTIKRPNHNPTSGTATRGGGLGIEEESGPQNVFWSIAVPCSLMMVLPLSFIAFGGQLAGKLMLASWIPPWVNAVLVSTYPSMVLAFGPVSSWLVTWHGFSVGCKLNSLACLCLICMAVVDNAVVAVAVLVLLIFPSLALVLNVAVVGMGLCFDNGSETRMRITVLSLPLVSAVLTSPMFIFVLDGGKPHFASFISYLALILVVAVVSGGVTIPNIHHKTRTIFKFRLSSVIEEDEEELSEGGTQHISVFALVRLEQIE